MKYISLDSETIGLRPKGGTVWMVQVAKQKEKAKVYHDYNGLKKLPKAVRKDLESEDSCKIIQNGEFDGPYLILNNLIDNLPTIWDTYLSEQVIQGVQLPRKKSKQELTPAEKKLYERYGCSLKYIAKRYKVGNLDKEIRTQFVNRPLGIPFLKKELNYAAKDADILYRIKVKQEEILIENNLLEVALLENKCLEKTIQMKVRGLRVDTKIWGSIINELTDKYNKGIASLPKQVKNWNSPKQVKDFFATRSIDIPSFKVIEGIAKETNDPILNKYVKIRKIFSVITKYGHGWLSDDVIDSDGRIRAHFNQIVDTGRYSISNPSLLTIPKDWPGAILRSAIVPDKGNVFVKSDFAGQELGIMAARSNEQFWVEALLRGEDLHSITASMLYRDEWPKAKKRGCKFPYKCSCPGHLKLREHTKTLNYMLAYGGGAQKFSETTGVPIHKAKVIIAKYKRVIPRLTRWLTINGKEALRTGFAYSADPYRRRRNLRAVASEDWHIVNQGKNSPIQMAGANMLKLAMISVPDKYPMVLPWHDEIILEVPKRQGPAAAKALKKAMEDAADYITGIKGIVTADPQITMNLMKS